MDHGGCVEQKQALKWLIAMAFALSLGACGGGSGGDSASGNAGVPANRVPVLGAMNWPDLLVEGEGYTMNLLASDTDGDSLKWSVQCAAPLVCSIRGDQLRIDSLASGLQANASVELAVDDGKGGVVQASRTVAAWPRPKDGKLQSIEGAAGRPGVHLLILGDGFTAADMGQFYRAANGFLKHFFLRPEVAAHREAWNVHVLDIISATSGITITAGANVTRIDSPLGTELGCGGIARLLCVDHAKTIVAAKAALPYYTHLLVIGNTSLYGGSGGAVTAVTLHAQVAPVALHELGHSFAGLADEYEDEAVADKYTFTEGRSPNVTMLTDPAKIPWRHWLEPAAVLPTVGTPAPGTDPVGLYEGGYYRSKGVFRPTYQSFMRNNDGPIGPVNGEAWGRAVFTSGGAWKSSAPAGATLAASAKPADGWLFEASPLLSAGRVETRWYVNGVEQSALRGLSTVTITQIGALTVRADLVDLSGRIRINSSVVSSRTWRVQ